MSPTQPKPTVFISYAHESAAFRDEVKVLADWLTACGCNVMSDHPYSDRPPPQGWIIWMQECIEDADVVLVVCTPKLKARYAKNAPLDSGRGATWEGAILTQAIYDAAMRNKKFFPILPDRGSEEHVPTFLKPWLNGHRFPSGNNGIRRLVFTGREAAHMVKTSGDEADSPLANSQSEHARMTIGLLEADDAKPFFTEMQVEIQNEFRVSPPETAAKMVDWFLSQSVDRVHDLLICIRTALNDISSVKEGRRSAEKAASALYFLCACCLVSKVEQASDATGLHLRVPRSENVFCAVVATAMFGGELILTPGGESGLPRNEHVIEIHNAAFGEKFYEEFERAVYCALFPNTEAAEAIADFTASINDDRRAEIAARFVSIRRVKKSCLALVVKGNVASQACQDFVSKYNAPVLSQTGVTEIGLALKPERLVADIREFWSELRELNEPVEHARQPQTGTSAASDQTPSSSPNKTTGNIDPVSNALDSAGKKLDGVEKVITKTRTIGALIAALLRPFWP